MTDFLFTDTHFGTKNHSLVWFRLQQKFIYDQFIPALEDHEGDIRVIHLGDVFDSRSGINLLIAKGVRKIFEDIAAIENVKELIIIAGNHDFYSPVNDECCTLETILNNIPKVRLVVREVYETDNEFFVPWYESEKGLSQFSHKTVYTHNDITNMCFENPVYSGHTHYPIIKEEDNSYNLGSCYPLTFADANDLRYFYKKEGNVLTKVANECSIKFWRIYNDELFNEVPFADHDYIEVYVDRESLTKQEYQSRISELRGMYKNLWIIPQQGDIDIQPVDVTMDMESIIESHIPENLLGKFNTIKQSLN